MPNRMKCGELKSIRLSAGLTQTAFAAQLGLNRKLVNALENGRVLIDRRTELAIQSLACRLTLVKACVWIEGSVAETYFVLRRTASLELSVSSCSPGYSEVRLVGEFTQRRNAERWQCAVERASYPRQTRRLARVGPSATRSSFSKQIDALFD